MTFSGLPCLRQVTLLIIPRPPKLRYQPGDYVFINIPSIAKNEWHPFTISSAPEQKGQSQVVGHRSQGASAKASCALICDISHLSPSTSSVPHNSFSVRFATFTPVVVNLSTAVRGSQKVDAAFSGDSRSIYLPLLSLTPPPPHSLLCDLHRKLQQVTFLCTTDSSCNGS